jgi:large subunit ribosomal protein L17
MRHHNENRKLGRKRNQRKALLKTLAVSLIKHGKINTTEAKAKELRPYVERLVTYAKTGKIADHRRILAQVGKVQAKKLISDTASRYKDRRGGYTRIVRMPNRKNDASPMAHIEFV